MTEPIARIEAALTRLGTEHKPPVGWEAEVFKKIKTPAEPKPSTWRRWLWVAPPVTAFAAVALWIGIGSPRADAFAVNDTLEDPVPAVNDAAVVRGPDRGSTRGWQDRDAPRVREAGLGQIVRVTTSGGADHSAVWIYRDDELVHECLSPADCRHTLSRLGRYRLVALTSKTALPRPQGTYDADVAAARTAGAEISDRELVVN